MEEQGNTEFDRNLVIEAKETRIVVGRLSAAEQEGDGKEGKRETLREEMREQREVVASFRHPLENREYRGAKSLYLG